MAKDYLITEQNAEQMRAAGIRSREIKKKERQRTARRMFDRGLTVSEIAANLGVKEAMAYRLIGSVKKRRQKLQRKAKKAVDSES